MADPSDSTVPDIEIITQAAANLHLDPHREEDPYASSGIGSGQNSGIQTPRSPGPTEGISSDTSTYTPYTHTRAKSVKLPAKFDGSGNRLPPADRPLNAAAPELPKDQIPTLEKLSVLRRAEQYPQWKSYLESAAAFGRWSRLVTEPPIPPRLGETTAEYAVLSESWSLVHKGLLPQLQCKIEHTLYEEHVAPRWKDTSELTIKSIVESLDAVFIPRGPISQVAAFSDFCILRRTAFPSSAAFCADLLKCLNKAAEHHIPISDTQASLRLVGECGPWHSGWYENFRLNHPDARSWPPFPAVRQSILDAEVTVGAHAPDRLAPPAVTGQANRATGRHASPNPSGKDKDKSKDKDKKGRNRSRAGRADTSSPAASATDPPAKKCSHCSSKTHNSDTCYYLHPELRPSGWKPYYTDIICVP
jgi:hypothetical protein